VADGGSRAAHDGEQQSAGQARDDLSLRAAVPEDPEGNSAKGFDVIDAIPPAQRGGDRPPETLPYAVDARLVRGPEDPAERPVSHPATDGPGTSSPRIDAADDTPRPLGSASVEPVAAEPAHGTSSGTQGASIGTGDSVGAGTGDNVGVGVDSEPRAGRGGDRESDDERRSDLDAPPTESPHQDAGPDGGTVDRPDAGQERREDPQTRPDPPSPLPPDARDLDEDRAQALLFVRSLAGVEHGTSKVQQERIQDYFATLPKEVTDWLVTREPDLIGNLRGVPPELRTAANTLAIRRELDSLPTVPGDVRQTEMLEQLLQPRVTNTWNPDGTERREEVPRQFIHFDPRGPGEVVEVIGDLRTAQTVAVFIPGMRTGLHNYAKFLDDVLHTRAAAGEENIAYVVWQGYHSPRGLGGLRSDWAEKGGRALLDTRHELGLLMRPGAELVFVAHSYGTVVTGKAISMGMTGDRFMFMGSPGVDWNIGKFSDLDPARPMRAWAMKAAGDFVPPSSWHGTPPDRWPDVVPLSTQGPREANLGHFGYYAQGTQGQVNIVAVITDCPSLADPARRQPDVEHRQGFLESGTTVIGRVKTSLRDVLPRDPAAPTVVSRTPSLREIAVAVSPEVNVAADLAQIWEGGATVDMRSGLCDVEGRVYAMKDGRWFPVSGEGVLQVNREHRLGFALLEQAAGDPDRAERLMDRHGVSRQVRDDLRPWFPARETSS
jgi:Alpha/beta hydrolase